MGKDLLLLALALVLFGAAPVLAAAPATARPAVEVSASELLGRWEPAFRGEHFSSAVAPPFVIAGDISASDLSAWRDHTILPAISALQSAYFKASPDEPILILLFSSDASYRKYAKAWFADTDVSHFGYFRWDGVMLMNISTGGGTLVHELVHSLLRPDFPECPNWINEGLGSLYEQCTLTPLKGLPNWRLAGLQKAMRAGTLRSLKDMIESTDFYDKPDVGINYAQARYLLMYLQEKDQLRSFYRRARDSHESDPAGLKALQSVIAPQELEAFEREWRQWVLKLRFP